MRRLAMPVLLAALGCRGDAPAAADAPADAPPADAALEAGAAWDEPDADDDAPRVFALRLVTPVFDRMEMPARDPEKATPEQKNVVRLGYLRKGASARIRGDPEKKPSCPEGWYALAQGGFVCGKFVTTDPYDLDLSDAPHPPYADRALPYDYGMSMGTGVPLYYRVPKKGERDKLEATIPVAKDPRAKKKDEAKTVDEGATSPKPEDDDTPWFLKHETGEKPKVSLDDLRKAGRGDLVERRMVKGFYVALDIVVSVRRYKENPQKFWRTTRSLLAPYEHVLVHEPKVDMKGIWLNAAGETRKLPLAIVSGFRAHRYKVREADGGAPPIVKEEKGKPDAKAKRLADAYDRFAFVQIKDRVVRDEHFREYWEIDDGKGEYLRGEDLAVARPAPKPADVGPKERWIDVSLAQQTLVAFEGDTPVFVTAISSGRHGEDAEQDHRTPKGDFRIWEKHVSATMEEDTATDGPYSIEDVPWIMYFHGGYALHGAFWHSKFGHERSHGCVNMAPTDAKELFGWVGPRLPAGWHGVRAVDGNAGTRVLVHD